MFRFVCLMRWFNYRFCCQRTKKQWMAIRHRITKTDGACVFFWVQNYCVIDFKLIGKNHFVYCLFLGPEIDWDSMGMSEADRPIISDSSHSHLFPRLKVIFINQASEFWIPVPYQSITTKREKMIHQIKSPYSLNRL